MGSRVVSTVNTPCVGGDAGDFGFFAQRCAVLGGGGHETVHDAVRIDKAIGGAEAAAENVVGAKLRQHGPNLFGEKQTRRLQAEFFLPLIIVAQVGEVRLLCRQEQVALGTVIGGVADASSNFA